MKTTRAPQLSSTMKTILATILLSTLLVLTSRGEGFTDAGVLFYGEVRQAGGAQTVLLQSGDLKLTLVNQGDATNVVTLSSSLRPTGSGDQKLFSYALRVPLKFLPDARQKDTYLSIGSAESDFRIETITIDGRPATLPDGSKEYYGLSFASRANQYRLDLLVTGDSTDTDGDGMPDWWEERFGLDSNLANAEGDFDGDGWSNLAEFRRGSNPAESNLDPELATTELLVPELGEAGCYLDIYDSDTAPADILLEIDPAPLRGFELRWDGNPIASLPSLNLAALQSGRLTIAHRDPAMSAAEMPITWTDGGEQKSGSLTVRVTSPSSTDGNDAALWLDADSLSDDELVATWNDRSGNDRNAMQPVEENRPLASREGGHNSVRFESKSHLFFQDGAIPTGNHTIFAAWQTNGARSETQVLLSSNRGFLQLGPSAEAVSYPGAPLYQVDGLAVRGYESALGTTSTSIFRREGTSIQNIFGLSFNGEEIAPEVIDPVLPTIGARRLALPVADPIQNGFRGDLHELLVFPTALPEQKLRDVHDYLQSKWSGFVTWDFSTNLRPATLTAAGDGRHIIRGGHGADDLRGGETANILSGGPGPDTLRGNKGSDTFVFGGVDIGRDTIIEFDPANDLIDLSALFWGESGDARQFLSTRLDTNFSTPVPTLDTVLIVQRSDATTQEIVLRESVFGPREIIELIVEGRIHMGGLSIPTDVSLALAAGSEDTTALRESSDQSFTVELTRNGDGVAGAMEVPLGLFKDALGRDLVIEGSASQNGQRALVTFARGETSKTVTFRPIMDLETEGVERWETAVLPHFRYEVTGPPVARTVSDDPLVRLAVIEANALTSGQAARVRLIREGATTSALTVALEMDGTAKEGEHLNSIPRSITIPSGQSFADLTITTAPAWDGAITRMALLRLTSQAGYLVGNPHEATIYAASSTADANGAGFERWLTATTEGRVTNLVDLLQNSEDAKKVGDYLRAYALGRDALRTPTGSGVSFRLPDQRPELRSSLATTAADLRWQVQSTSDDQEWSDVSAAFTQSLTTEGLTLLGPPIDPGEKKKLYRLNFSLEGATNLDTGLDALANASRFGMTGPSWQTDPQSGHLVSTATNPGSVSRLVVQVDAPTVLEFDMTVRDGDGSDLLTFSINGIRVAETRSDSVLVTRTLDAVEPTLLMWEFHAGTGTATIRNPTRTPLP